MTTQAQARTAPPPLSQSRQQLLACPHLYSETIIRGQVEPDNHYAARGREVHDFLHDYTRHLVESRQPFDTARFDEMLHTRSLSSDASEILEGLRDIIKIDPEQVLCSEQRFYLDDQFAPVFPGLEQEDSEAELYIGDEDVERAIAYEGKPDLVLLIDSVTAKIPDYKSQYQIMDADTFQGKQYALLVFCHYPFIERVIFELQFVRYGGATRSVEYTRQQLPLLKKAAQRERTRQLALHQNSAHDTGFPLPAMPGDHCCWCPKLRQGCPIAELNPYTNQTPEDRLRFELWARAALKVNTQALQAHVNASGPVTVKDGNGSEYRRSYEAKERSTFPLVPVLSIITDWIKRGGDDFTEKLAIRSTKLKGYLKAKKRADLAAAVEPAIEKETYTRWTLSGVDQPDEESYGE